MVDLFLSLIWDFDWETFLLDCNNMGLVSCLWYEDLFKYAEFRKEVKSRWAELKDTFLSIDEYIKTQAEAVRYSNEVNLAKWPISVTVNGDVNLSYDDAIESMRAAYNYRLNVVDDYIKKL